VQNSGHFHKQTNISGHVEISGQFQDNFEISGISGISGQLGPLCLNSISLASIQLNVVVAPGFLIFGALSTIILSSI